MHEERGEEQVGPRVGREGDEDHAGNDLLNIHNPSSYDRAHGAESN